MAARRVSQVTPSFERRVRFALEYGFVRTAFGLLGRLSPDQSSALCGRLLTTLGRRSKRHDRALANLERVFPQMDAQERERIADGMWTNFGRVLGEYPHLGTMLADPDRVRFEGMDEVRAVLDGGTSALLVSAHYGNWEMTTAAGRSIGLRQANLYRQASNRKVDQFLLGLRAPTASGGFIKKSDKSVREIMRALKGGKAVGLLVDQRERRGIRVPFLGINASTAQTPALIAKRMGVPVFVGRARRMAMSGPDAARFIVECRHVPIDDSGDTQADIYAATESINDLFSQWIREDPAQWLWYHRRFK